MDHEQPQNTLMLRAERAWQTLLYDETGQDLIEYALVACLLALGAIATVKNVGVKVASVFAGIATGVTTAV